LLYGGNGFAFVLSFPLMLTTTTGYGSLPLFNALVIALSLLCFTHTIALFLTCHVYEKLYILCML